MTSPSAFSSGAEQFWSIAAWCWYPHLSSWVLALPRASAIRKCSSRVRSCFVLQQFAAAIQTNCCIMQNIAEPCRCARLKILWLTIMLFVLVKKKNITVSITSINKPCRAKFLDFFGQTCFFAYTILTYSNDSLGHHPINLGSAAAQLSWGPAVHFHVCCVHPVAERLGKWWENSISSCFDMRN